MGHWIDIEPAGEAVVRAYLALPQSAEGPGLLLCPETLGSDASLRALADRYAEEGYVVIAPDLPAERGPAFDALAAAAAALRRLPACRGRIGGVGHGPGGGLVARAAEAGLIDCAVSYYGVDPEELGRLGAAAVPMVFHHAGADGPVDARRVDVSRGRGAVEHYIYPGAGHGFDAPGQPSYDASAATMAYSRTLALLRRELGPHYDLSALWEAHRACEFEARDADATLRTMVAEPYVNHVPTLTGGYGQADLHRFYRDHFIPGNPKDMRNIPISRTVGADRVVNEGILSFTHDTVIDWMLPGIAPTGRHVEVALVGIVTFRGDKLVHEHIYWDQASVLVQIGLLDPSGLPVAGAEAARKVREPSLPSRPLPPGSTG